jgi:adenine-specific DNA-methyltransferase
MRYIGNKNNLVDFIKTNISNTIGNVPINKLYDLFSGTGGIAEAFKTHFNVVGNDLLISSYIITNARLNGEIPHNIDHIVNIINTKEYDGIITNNYSEHSGRLYFSHKNGMKIDGMRLYIEELLNTKIINKNEYNYLLYCLLEAVHKVSNTTGVYGAFLKKLNNNAINTIVFNKLEIIDSQFTHECYNSDCTSLIENINENDILYLDPPYNTRQYGSNYHLLETLVKYTLPDIKIIKDKESISGLTNDLPKSKWCSKTHILTELTKIIESKSKYIFISYNTDGLLSESNILTLLSTYGNVEIKRKSHKKYKSNVNNNEKFIEELLFCLVKNSE